jgi:hypothetical protein
MIWTLFDFCFLRFDYLPPRLPAHTSQKSTPPLQGVEICAATNFEIQIKIELRNFEIVTIMHIPNSPCLNCERQAG